MVGQLGHGPPREERDAVHGAVAGDRKIGKEMVGRRVPGIFDRGDDTHLQLTRRQQFVELRRGSGHESAGMLTMPRSIAPYTG